jgi:hypothetical protein
MKLIHTDNFGGDYPNEKCVEGLPMRMAPESLEAIADICNKSVGLHCSRFWKVVPDDYVLQPGFEP